MEVGSLYQLGASHAARTCRIEVVEFLSRGAQMPSTVLVFLTACSMFAFHFADASAQQADAKRPDPDRRFYHGASHVEVYKTVGDFKGLVEGRTDG